MLIVFIGLVMGYLVLAGKLPNPNATPITPPPSPPPSNYTPPPPGSPKGINNPDNLLNQGGGSMAMGSLPTMRHLHDVNASQGGYS
jgi:hypothetical protein